MKAPQVKRDHVSNGPNAIAASEKAVQQATLPPLETDPEQATSVWR